MSGVNDKNDKDVVILGAGPTGLGVSLGLILNNSRSRATVVEKNERVGGLAGSFSWKRHIVDFGPHRLSPNIETIRVLAHELLGPECIYQRSQHGVHLKGKLYQFPPRIIDWLSPLSVLHLLRYGFSYFCAKIVWVTRRFKSETFSDLIVSRFGKSFYRDIVAPMTEKVWTEPDNIDQSFATQRFSLIQPLTVLKKLIVPKQDLSPSHFIYPKKGFQQLWDRAMEFSAGQGHTFCTGSKPKKIVVEGNRAVQVVLEGAHEQVIDLSESILISTIPISAFLAALELRDSPLDKSELLALAEKIKFRSMILACFEFEGEELLPFRTQIYPEKAHVFNRLFEQNKYSRDTIEPGKSVIVADITYPLGGWAVQQTDAQLLDLVKADLQKLSYIPLDQLTDSCVRRVPYAYVVPDKEGKAAMHQLHHQLKRLANVQFAGRFSVGEYDNSDYALMTGVSLSAFLSDRISRLDYMKRLHLQFNPIVG